MSANQKKVERLDAINAKLKTFKLYLYLFHDTKLLYAIILHREDLHHCKNLEKSTEIC